MKKTISKLLISILLFSSFFLSTPSVSHAQLPGFGGFTIFDIPCTCSGTLYVWYTPLWLGGILLSGPMVYSPFSTLLFAYYMIGVPGTWALGNYVPAAPSCWMIVPAPTGVACIPWPAIGTMFFTGTGAL